jgi:hypothetical protein
LSANHKIENRYECKTLQASSECFFLKTWYNYEYSF